MLKGEAVQPATGPDYRTCETDEDCESGKEFCYPGLLICRPFQCVADRDCEEEQVCDLSRYTCVALRCEADDDCIE